MHFDKTVSSVEIDWKLHNFKKDFIKEIKSAKLIKAFQATSFIGDNRTTWIFKVFGTAQRLSLVPHLVHADNRNFRVQFSWLIPTIQQKPNLRRYLDHFEAHCNTYEEFRGGLTFFNLDELFNDPANYYIDNDTLMIKIRIDLIGGFMAKPNINPDVAEEMSWEYEQMFTTQRFSDIKVLCSDGFEIPSHRVILAASSPIFRQMLESSEMENYLFIEDASANVMDEVLIFLYGKDPDHLTKENFPAIYYVSEKYIIPDLQEMVVEKIISYLTNDNVLDYLQLAMFYLNYYLMKRCLVFIKYNYDDLKQRFDFNQLENNMFNMINHFIHKYKIKNYSISSTLPDN